MDQQMEGRTIAFFRQQGVYLRFRTILTPNEVSEFVKRQQNFVVVSTDMNPRRIPELLQLNKDKIFKEGFSIEIDGVSENFWKDKKSEKKGGVN